MTIFGRLMQRGRPVVVLGCHVGTLLFACPWQARCNGVDSLLNLREFASSGCFMTKIFTISIGPQKAA